MSGYKDGMQPNFNANNNFLVVDENSCKRPHIITVCPINSFAEKLALY